MLATISRNVLSNTYTMHIRRASKWSLFGRGGQKEMYEVAEESKEMEDYQTQLKEVENEAREEYIESQRNKSRLSASDRQMVRGLPPNVGVLYEYNNVHRSRKFKREMLGKYGTKTGIDPAISWPTKRDLDLAKEWESLYQPEPLDKMIMDHKDSVAKLKQDRIDREKVIIESLEKMDANLKQWRNRVETKNKQANSERLRREKVLSELKAEFGYDVNPNDEYMKGRIADREKELVKEEKEAKKAAKKDRFGGDPKAQK